MQVTAEGGLAHVTQGKKWIEVAAAFQFPASCTSRSYTLKQCYSRLLYEFEQVYFHQYSGPLPVPPSSRHSKLIALLFASVSKRFHIKPPLGCV